MSPPKPRRNRPQPGSRYARYAGGPDPLAPPVDLAEALDAIGQEVMAGSSPEAAMREFLRRGGEDGVGLDDLARRVARRRQELLRRNRLDGTLDEIRELLDRAVLEERKQLARDLDDDARFSEMRMTNLPNSTAAAVNELGDYSWRSHQAREDFDKIKDLLGREMLDQQFAGMKQALENATDQDRARVNEMLSDLNDLLDKHARGEDTAQAFDDFMAKHGDFFPENPRNVDELLDSLAARAAAAQRMRNSMTQAQRDELDALAQQAFGGPELSDQLARLGSQLQQLRPGEDWGGSQRFDGEQGLGLGDGTGVLQDLAELDSLSEQLSQQYAGASLSDVDLEAIERQLGDEARVSAETLAQLERALRDSGYLQRGSDGSLKLSPKAMRRLGKELLRDVANRISGRTGQRDVRLAGAAGEASGATRAWEFGDTAPWDVTRTVLNGVQRSVGEGVDPRHGLRLKVDDVEVSETEARSRAAVALLVDTSFSMAIEGRWVPMKRTGLALHQLVSTRFRGDHLQLISFGRHAEVMQIDQLTPLAPAYEQGTNLHHGLLLANRHFRKHPHEQPVLLIVTDGEPTAHLEADGSAIFGWPPSRRTLALSLEELEAAHRLGAQTTFFRLGDDPGLARFIDAIAKRVEGKVVAPDLDDLGSEVIGSYLNSRWL